jgi:hypothetical protein
VTSTGNTFAFQSSANVPAGTIALEFENFGYRGIFVASFALQL